MSQKCPKCHEKLEKLELSVADAEKVKRPSGVYYVCHKCKFAAPECEVWSRVVGYLRPTKDWNKGKREEFDNRKEYKPFKEDKNGN